MLDRFHYITGNLNKADILKKVQAYCKSGGRCLQLRMKELSQEEMLAIGHEVRSICSSFNCSLIINDYVHLALLLDADGVHLGKKDMSPTDARSILKKNQIIGSTCNTIEDIKNVLMEGQSDYIGLGPFRYTKTKEELAPVLGWDGLSRVMEYVRINRIDIPILVVGGIQEDDIDSIVQLGAHGVAVSGLVEKGDNLESLIKHVNILTQEKQNGKIEIGR